MSANRNQTPEEKHKARKLIFDRNPAGEDGFELFATTDMNFRLMVVKAGPGKAEAMFEKLKDREDFKAQLIKPNGMPSAAFVTSFEGTPIYPFLREHVVGLVKDLYSDKLTEKLVLPAQKDVLDELKIATDATPFNPNTAGSKYLIDRINEIVGQAEKDVEKIAEKVSEDWMNVSEKPPTQHGAYDTQSKEDEDESYNPGNRKRANKSDDEISSTGSASSASAAKFTSPRPRKRRCKDTAGKAKRNTGDDEEEDMDENA